MPTLKVNEIIAYSGNTLSLGTSGNTVNIPANVTFNTASATLTLPSTIKVDTIQNTNSSTLITQTNSTTITVGVSGQTVALPSQSISYAAISNPVNFRNRIINGDMSIDQRNDGASITANNDTFSVDRWKIFTTQSSKLTVQQNAGAVTPPAGFNYYLGYTSSSSYSITSTDLFVPNQGIEGYNVADLDFGTANAKSITLSFWVRSSLTGTFGGTIRNGSANRNYPFTYTISTSNTWEYKTVTIAGDTSGTWNKTNGYGLGVQFGLGVGATYSGTAGAWSSNTYYSATGATSLVGTSGATWYITGVQLEAGSQASGFEFMPIDANLIRCQRYFTTCYDLGTVIGTVPASNQGAVDILVPSGGTGYFITTVYFPVTMRATPTISVWDNAGTSGTVYKGASGQTPNIANIGQKNVRIGSFSAQSAFELFFWYQASAEL